MLISNIRQQWHCYPSNLVHVANCLTNITLPLYKISFLQTQKWTLYDLLKCVYIFWSTQFYLKPLSVLSELIITSHRIPYTFNERTSLWVSEYITADVSPGNNTLRWYTQVRIPTVSVIVTTACDPSQSVFQGVEVCTNVHGCSL